MKTRNKIAELFTTGLVAAGIMIGGAWEEYLDFPGDDEGNQAGRAKNSYAAMVTGLIAQRMYPNSTIDVDVVKSFYPDAHVEGTVTPYSIDTYVPLTLTSATFKAKTNDRGLLEGKVDKSGFDWIVEQTGPDSYQVGRFCLKFDNSVSLVVANGRIVGKIKRGIDEFNWTIDGTYDNDGNIEVGIDGPVNWGIGLEGKITQQINVVEKP